MQSYVLVRTSENNGRRARRLLVGSAMTLAAVATVIAYGGAGMPGQGLEMTRSVIGGGAVYASGGGFELSATMGQAAAGVHSGGRFELNGGFWFPLPPGDYNDDGLVNLLDYAEFMACITGPGGNADGPDCAVFDVDQSGDVDLLDFAEIQRTFSGM